MIKIGDKLQPTEKARINYGFDGLSIKLPIVVANVFQVKEGPTYVQFLAPDIYNRDGAMILRTWNARNLEPYKPKPRWRQIKTTHLRAGMKFLLPPERVYTVQGFSAIGPNVVICKVGNYTTVHMSGDGRVWVEVPNG